MKGEFSMDAVRDSKGTPQVCVMLAARWPSCFRSSAGFGCLEQFPQAAR